MARISKHTPELVAIAEQLKALTVAGAPVKDGTLRNTIKSFNTINKMITFDAVSKRARVKVDYAPPGANYGIYWNDPYGKGIAAPALNSNTTATIKARYPNKFNFAVKALQDVSIDKLIAKYTKALAKDVITEVVAELRKN
jgi:hypothetical protein